MPAAGHYSDMQTLMQNMETLSGWLQQNREDFIRVQEGLDLVERRNVSWREHREGATFRDRSNDNMYRLDIHKAPSMEIQFNVCTSLPPCLSNLAIDTSYSSRRPTRTHHLLPPPRPRHSNLHNRLPRIFARATNAPPIPIRRHPHRSHRAHPQLRLPAERIHRRDSQTLRLLAIHFTTRDYGRATGAYGLAGGTGEVERGDEEGG